MASPKGGVGDDDGWLRSEIVRHANRVLIEAIPYPDMAFAAYLTQFFQGLLAAGVCVPELFRSTHALSFRAKFLATRTAFISLDAVLPSVLFRIR